MVKTGIFIRALVDGKWDNFDIGDPRLPTEAVMSWLRSQGGKNVLAENTVLALLDRPRIANQVNITYHRRE